MPKNQKPARGAGRPPVDPALRKDPLSVKLPRWLIDWTGDQDTSRAVLIETALVATYKLKPPAVAKQ